MTAKVYNALCRKGPLDGKVRAVQAQHFKEGDGLYVYRAADGPTPATWAWVPAKKEIGN